MVAPFTTRDLNQRCMAERIFDLTELYSLYPETPKESFRKFVSSQAPTTANGYVKWENKTNLEGYFYISNFIFKVVEL